MCKRIQVERRPVGLIRPQPQKHRSLEHETLTLRRTPEAAKKALEEVVSKRDLEILAALAREV
jgi:hypothetical protein